MLSVWGWAETCPARWTPPARFGPRSLGPAPAPHSTLAAGGTVPTEKPSKKVFLEGATNWPRQWFWGGQAGLLVFHTDYDGFSAEPTFGGHWLITAKKTALYVGYEQSFFLTNRHATVI